MTTADFTFSYCAVSLIALAAIYYYYVTKMRPDAYRVKIRRIRDDLFDFMWRNGYDFDTPAYRKARTMLNDLLRVSNFLSIPVMVIAAAARVSKAGGEDDAEAIDLPPGPLGERIALACAEAMQVTVEYVFLTGPKGWLMRGLIILIGAARATLRWKPLAQQAVKTAIRHAGQLVPSVPPPRGPLVRVG